MVNLALIVWAAAGFSGSCGGTTQNGRCVMAHSDTWYVDCDFKDDTATITTPGNVVVVSPTVIDVDGQTQIPIVESTATVDVQINHGAITLVADGKILAVCSSNLAK